MDERIIAMLKQAQEQTEANLKIQAQAVAAANSASSAMSTKILTNIKTCYDMLEKNNAGIATLTAEYGKAWETFAKSQLDIEEEIKKLNL